MGELLDEEAKAHDAQRGKLRDRLRDLEIALANTKADVSNLRSMLLTNGKVQARSTCRHGRSAASRRRSIDDGGRLNNELFMMCCRMRFAGVAPATTS
jgi:hypothetical protein